MALLSTWRHISIARKNLFTDKKNQKKYQKVSVGR